MVWWTAWVVRLARALTMRTAQALPKGRTQRGHTYAARRVWRVLLHDVIFAVSLGLLFSVESLGQRPLAWERRAGCPVVEGDL